MAKKQLTDEEISTLKTSKGLLKMLAKRKINHRSILDELAYEQELELLQIELIKLQQWVIQSQQRVAILFEGRDAAGKGGTILRFTQHLIPRALRIVALPKPNETERGQWYFQRYVNQLPTKGEMAFFDRSWYNRAVVEPAMGFCTEAEYERFMQQVSEFEHMLWEDGILLIKFWFNLSRDEQVRRLESRRKNPLKQWKISPVDEQAQAKWDIFTHYREEMFKRTHTDHSPWVIVEADNKQQARLNAIRYALYMLDYPEKSQAPVTINPDKKLLKVYEPGMQLHD
jgi:polyphosphate kinase 2